MSSKKESSGRKRNKKFYCSQNPKKRKLEGLEPGLKGFLITCNDKKEAPTVSEAYTLLNEYADRLYGPENAREDGEEDEKEELSIEEALSKEICDLKEKVKERRFKSVKTKVKNVLFIKTSSLDPNELVNSIFEDLEKTRKKKSRRCMKFMPVMSTCYASADSILQNAKRMFQEYFKLNRHEATFCVSFKSRCNNTVKRDELVPGMAKIIEELNEEWTVRYKIPDYTVMVDIIANVCSLGILKDFDRFRKYNLQSMTEDIEAKDDKSTVNESKKIKCEQEIENEALDQEIIDQEIIENCANDVGTKDAEILEEKTMGNDVIVEETEKEVKCDGAKESESSRKETIESEKVKNEGTKDKEAIADETPEETVKSGTKVEEIVVNNE